MQQVRSQAGTNMILSSKVACHFFAYFFFFFMSKVFLLNIFVCLSLPPRLSSFSPTAGSVTPSHPFLYTHYLLIHSFSFNSPQGDGGRRVAARNHRHPSWGHQELRQDAAATVTRWVCCAYCCLHFLFVLLLLFRSLSIVLGNLAVF